MTRARAAPVRLLGTLAKALTDPAREGRPLSDWNAARMSLNSSPMAATTMLISERELDFLLYELLDTEKLLERPRYAEHSREIFDATLDTASPRCAMDAPSGTMALTEPSQGSALADIGPTKGCAAGALRRRQTRA